MNIISGSNAIKIDGRLQRSERTHKRIIDAVIGLVEAGNTDLRVAEIARQADVSVRSIFQHFPDLKALYVAAADAHSRRLLSELQPVHNEGALESRVVTLVAERAAHCERSLALRKVAGRFESTTDAGGDQARFARDVQRRRSEIYLRRDIALLPEQVRRELLDAIEASVDIDAWLVLRVHSKLDVTAAELVWRRLVLAVVRDAIQSSRPATEVSAGQTPSSPTAAPVTRTRPAAPGYWSAMT
jgi:AcrR family transcriptional regulator